MEKREKILAIVLAGALGVGWLGPQLWSWFQGPVYELESTSRNIGQKLDKKQQELNIALAKLRKMKGWKSRSLPPDPQVAALAYQQWLTDLTEIVVRFSDLKVSAPTQPSSRNKPYVAVRVTVSGQASLMQVREFLYRFHRADVLHHLTDLKLDSQQSEGNPLLLVSLTAEGLALKDAPPRTATLFARTQLKSGIDDSTMSLEVTDTVDFPEEVPFRIRIGSEYLTVTEAKKSTWTVKRQVDSSRATTHSSDSVVEWAPIHPDWKDRTLDDTLAVVDLNPFAKPGKYEPRLELVGNKVIRRGDPIDLKVTAAGFGPKHGTPTFALAEEAPPGLLLDVNTGQFTWTQPDDLAAQNYSVAVSATAFGLDAPLNATFDLTLQEPNVAPVIDAIDPQMAYLGQEFMLKVTANDDHTPIEELKFSLGETPPAGATIDESTGEFRWTPGDGQALGDVQVTINVADQSDPSMTASLPIAFTVQDDVAQYTVLTAAIAADEQRQAWLYDQSSNKRLVLREGDKMQYGGVDALVMAIGRDFVTLQFDDESWRMKLGENLRDVQAAVAAAQQEADDAVTADSDQPEAESETEDESGETKDEAGDYESDPVMEETAVSSDTTASATEAASSDQAESTAPAVDTPASSDAAEPSEKPAAETPSEDSTEGEADASESDSSDSTEEAQPAPAEGTQGEADTEESAESEEGEEPADSAS